MSLGRDARVSALVCAAVATAVVCTAEPALGFDRDHPARILYVGDSLAANTAAEVVAATQNATGQSITTHSAFPGMAICDFLETPGAEMKADARLRAQIRSARPHLVILQFWGNAFTKCMADAPTNTLEYYRRYYYDADRAVRAIEETSSLLGIARPRILWVLQGPEPDVRGRTPLLNSIYTWIAAQHGDRTSDAGALLSAAADPRTDDEDARTRWVQSLPCTAQERGTPYCTHPNADGGLAQLHTNEDPIHFCLGSHEYHFKCDRPSPAIRRYGGRIARDANAWLGIE